VLLLLLLLLLLPQLTLPVVLQKSDMFKQRHVHEGCSFWMAYRCGGHMLPAGTPHPPHLRAARAE
jgi:hypothetical protein